MSSWVLGALMACGGDAQGSGFDPGMSAGVPGESGDDDDDDDDDDSPSGDDDDDDSPSGDDDDDDTPGDDDDDDAPSAGCPGGEAAWDEVIAQAQAYLDTQQAPGAALAVVCDGVLSHAAGFGTTNADTGAPVTASTRFQLASVTKMFTGAAAVALAEDGLVDLHAPIGDELDVAYGGVTLHQLLTHTAGFPTELDTVMSNDLVTVMLSNGGQPMWAPPGAVWFYSNPGYSAAGAVLELASGSAFADLVESRLFAPAGMDRATMHVDAVLAEGDYAFGHEGNPASPTTIAPDGSYFQTGLYGPQGGAWGSVEDLAHWGEVHVAGGGEVMSAAGIESLRAFHTRTDDSERGYGYGLFVESYWDPDVVSHGGGAPGFVSHWWLSPELGFGVFAVTNGDWVSARELGDIAMERYTSLGWDGAPPSDPAWAELTGTYVDPISLGTMVVTQAGGGLQAQIDGGAAVPMEHVWEDMFLVSHPAAGGQIDVTFWRSGGAQAQYLVSIWGVATRQ